MGSAARFDSMLCFFVNMNIHVTAHDNDDDALIGLLYRLMHIN